RYVVAGAVRGEPVLELAPLESGALERVAVRPEPRLRVVGDVSAHARLGGVGQLVTGPGVDAPGGGERIGHELGVLHVEERGLAVRVPVLHDAVDDDAGDP